MKKLDVFYSGWGEHWQLGQLADDGRQILFEYSFEAQRQALELSPLQLKLAPHAYSDFPQHQMRLPGFIADSLPDGWGILLMDKMFRKQGINLIDISPLDRLAFLGNRAMGALTYVPSSPSILEAHDFTIMQIAEEIHKLIADEATAALQELAVMGGSPQGARPKVLVNYDRHSKKISTKSTAFENPWLIKFPSAGEHKEVCAIESLYASLAKMAGLEMAEVEYFDLGKNLAAFGTKRFDRQKNIRVPVHTLAGALHADFRIPSSVDYLSYLKLTRAMTHDEREVLKAFRACVFNVVFNNRDDHPKNFSFLLDRKRNWKLSPVYDLNYSVGPGGEHHMDICGEGKNPGRSHLLLLAEKGGLNKKICTQMIDEVLTVARKFKVESRNWPIRKTTVEKIEEVIKLNVAHLK